MNCGETAWKSNEILKSSENGLGKYWKSVKKCEQLITGEEIHKIYCFYKCFPEKLGHNFLEILWKFWRYFEIIL